MSGTTNESVGEQIIKIIDELLQNDNLQASPSVWYGLHQIKQLLSADVVEVVRCKDCIHFELDKPYIIQGVPVLGHEVCNAWGDGCKTDQNGFCFMGERRTDEVDC